MQRSVQTRPKNHMRKSSAFYSSTCIPRGNSQESAFTGESSGNPASLGEKGRKGTILAILPHQIETRAASSLNISSERHSLCTGRMPGGELAFHGPPGEWRQSSIFYGDDPENPGRKRNALAKAYRTTWGSPTQSPAKSPKRKERRDEEWHLKRGCLRSKTGTQGHPQRIGSESWCKWMRPYVVWRSIPHAKGE